LPRLSVQAVVCDMDGTLFDTEALYRVAFMQAVAAFGYTLSETAYRSLIGISSRERGALMRRHLGEGFPWAACLADYAGRKAGLLRDGIPLKPGAAELLDELAARGVPRGLATSATRPTALGLLGRAGLLDRFDCVVTRDDVERGKPHPDPFLRAAACLGVPPERCVALEDSPPGVHAAHAAGMPAIMVPDALAATEEVRRKCLAVAADLHEVAGLLRSV